MAASMPRASRFGSAASGTTVGVEYEVTAFTPRMTEDIYSAAGMRGTRGEQSERVVQNTRAPGFSVTLQPNAVELDTILPWILGGSETADSFPLAETLPTFSWIVDMGGTARWYWTTCTVNTATFSATQGGPLELTMDVEALAFSTDSTAFGSTTVSLVPPYMFYESASALVVNSQTLAHFNWSLTINNMLVTNRFTNSQTRTALPSAGREVTWALNGPYGDNTALFGLAATGVACTATFTKGGRSTLFSSSAVSFPREFPQFAEELQLPITGLARRLTTTQELVVTNDSTA